MPYGHTAFAGWHESRQHIGLWPGQAPQITLPPQPFETVPQICVPQTWVGSAGVQPQTLTVPPPPQVWGATHWVVPQSTFLPQLSRTRPHLPLQVVVIAALTQPQTFGIVGSPPQVRGAAHWVVPQST